MEYFFPSFQVLKSAVLEFSEVAKGNLSTEDFVRAK